MTNATLHYYCVVKQINSIMSLIQFTKATLHLLLCCEANQFHSVTFFNLPRQRSTYYCVVKQINSILSHFSIYQGNAPLTTVLWSKSIPFCHFFNLPRQRATYYCVV